jgi:DNA damage-binding protein 1
VNSLQKKPFLFGLSFVPLFFVVVHLITFHSYRFEEVLVIQLAFLHGCNSPTIAVLHQDNRERRHLKTYEYNVKSKELSRASWTVSNVENGAQHLIPVKENCGGGVLVIGEESITYYSAKANSKSIRMKSAQITAWGLSCYCVPFVDLHS